jgi:hypothetical protein
MLMACIACAAPNGNDRSTAVETTRTISTALTETWRVDSLATAPSRFRPAGWSDEHTLWGLLRGRVTRLDTRTGTTRSVDSAGWALVTAPGVAAWHNRAGTWMYRDGGAVIRLFGPDGVDTTRRGDGPQILFSPNGERALLGWQHEWDTFYDLLERDGTRRSIETRIPGYMLNSATLWLDSTRVLFQTVATGPIGGEPQYKESGWRGDLAVLDSRAGSYGHVTRGTDGVHSRVAGWLGDDVLVTEWDSTGVRAHVVYNPRSWQRRPASIPRGRAFGSRGGAAVVLLDTNGDSTDAVLVAGGQAHPLGRVARDAEAFFTPSGKRGVIHATTGVIFFAATP